LVQQNQEADVKGVDEGLNERRILPYIDADCGEIVVLKATPNRVIYVRALRTAQRSPGGEEVE
jgi:Fe-S cluster biogenesis protein NfuA